MSTSSLGQRIRELRLRKGMTQIELAKGICTASMISQIESDRARPSYKMLVGLANRLEVALEHLLKEVDLEMEYTSKYKLAMGMMRAKEYGTAVSLLESLLQVEQHRIAKENLMLELVRCHLGLGNVEEAESGLNLLHQMVNNGVDDHLLVLVLLYLGKVGMLKSEFQIALYHTNRAWDELRKQEEIDPDVQAKILLQLAALHETIGKAAEAVKYYEEALLLNQGKGEDRGRTYLRLAELCDRAKRFELAEEYAGKACRLFEEGANQEDRQEVQRRLILLQRESGDWQGSLQKLLKMAEQYEQDGCKSKAGEVYADTALLCLEHGEYDGAWVYADKARMGLQDTSHVVGHVHRVFSSVYFHRKDEQRGMRHLENAANIFEQHGKVAEFEKVMLEICRFLSGRGEDREAFEGMERLHRFLMGQLQTRGIIL
ncbi:hypothetical protein CBW65_23615 [Tumebacillus avium]|uniref:HTH cro/C1-type domain-containing protein n=1 Tax=Tumebacillus avium TaxID=1903704 RepID=A0A1Y0IWC0_9BACL|nr:helix-turn-helix transcriptional regulator [Tumebacillus avium]ARU63673.1 hypothetical protein CBW65_23615 [Tumebacillus avium]